ncbi:protein phosphatase 1 regulatory subunit 12A-like [Procambarus clarkii]|uniref:protein phosphatase 1 regulatory subunit 12A-like n=1 Tax=Procambarus clarkii TaxID=6728 RepID=UPI00374456A3
MTDDDCSSLKHSQDLMLSALVKVVVGDAGSHVAQVHVSSRAGHTVLNQTLKLYHQTELSVIRERTTELSGRTALFWAVGNSYNTVKVLLDAGADVNATDYEEMAENEVDISRRIGPYNCTKNRPVLVQFSNEEAVEYIMRNKHLLRGRETHCNVFIERFITKDEQIAHKNGWQAQHRTPSLSGKTALHQAVAIGRHNMVKVLLDAGVNINAADKYGKDHIYASQHYITLMS